MAMNDHDYCMTHGLAPTDQNYSYVARVRIAGRWLRERARNVCDDAREAAGGGIRGPNAPEAVAYLVAHRAIDEFEARAMAARRACRDRKSRMAIAPLLALRLRAPLRPVDRCTDDVDGLALFDRVRQPFMF